MATIINADTTNGLKLTSDTSGEIELQSAGTTIATVDSTGLTMASGKLLASTGPAFSATRTTTQTFSDSTFTKLQVNTETFDTNSNYDSTTNYRFTPTIEGYYQINGNITFAGASAGYVQVAIFKNGGLFINGSGIPNNTSVGGMATASSVIFLNGSTDYVEFYAWQNSGGSLGLLTGTGRNTFSGCMVRGAS